MDSDTPLFLRVDIAGRDFRRLNFEHPRVVERVLTEMGEGVPVYYDRVWPPTVRFCSFLLEDPGLVEGRHVLVVGAGAGLEAVVVGTLCDSLWVNDMAPGALELLGLQLEANGVTGYGVLPGSYGDVELPEAADLVVGSFVVYDEGSARAMTRLLERTADRGLPVLLGDQDIGGHVSRVLADQTRDLRILLDDDDTRVFLIGA